MNKEKFQKLSKSKNSFHRHCLQQNVCFYNGKDIFVDFIGRFENLEEDWKVVGQNLGIERGLPHLNKNKNKRSKNLYTTKTIDEVARIYEKDVELLGYEYRLHN
jgi:hypothetical protein